MNIPEISEQRFWAKVEKTDSCWIWRGGIMGRGYGTFFVDGVSHRVHRLAYRLLVGEIEEELTVDHLCKIKICVNPSHMELVTRAENSRRAFTGIVQCPKGHPYDESNTIFHGPLRRNRKCRQCNNARRRKEFSAINR